MVLGIGLDVTSLLLLSKASLNHPSCPSKGLLAFHRTVSLLGYFSSLPPFFLSP